MTNLDPSDERVFRRARKPGEISPIDPIIRGWRGASEHAGKSIPQLKRDVRAGSFPAPIEIGPNSLARHSAEIEAWRESRPRRTSRAPELAGGAAP